MTDRPTPASTGGADRAQHRRWPDRTGVRAAGLAALAWLAFGTPLAGQTDTTFAVAQGGRLELARFQGGVEVRVWDRAQVRIQQGPGASAAIRTVAGGRVVRVEQRGARTGRAALSVTVPRRFEVHVAGWTGPVRIEGVEGTVEIDALEGDMEIVGGAGTVAATTLRGTIRVEDRTGDVTVNTLDRSIHITRVRGAVHAVATNGEIHLLDLESPYVRATSLNGAIHFEARLDPQGTYQLSTHHGAITYVLAEGVNVTVRAIALAGRLDSDFPIRLLESGPTGRYTVVQGEGGATVMLESFAGDIRLRRPSRMP